MVSIKELNLPLDEDVLLRHAANWISGGERPIPLDYLRCSRLPVPDLLVLDPESLSALFIALHQGLVTASGICSHIGPMDPYVEESTERPPQNKRVILKANEWRDFCAINWRRSELTDALLLNVTYKQVMVNTKNLLSTFPSLRREESCIKPDALACTDDGSLSTVDILPQFESDLTTRKSVAVQEPARQTQNSQNVLSARRFPTGRPAIKRNALIAALRERFPDGDPKWKMEAVIEEIKPIMKNGGYGPPVRSTMQRALKTAWSSSK